MTISAFAATLGLIIFPLAMIYAGAMDLFTLKIRNKLVLAIACAWLLLAPLAGFSLHELGWSVAVAALVFVCTFTMFSLGWIGGGDAKLAAVAALWFQPQEALLFFIYASRARRLSDAGHPAIAHAHAASGVLPRAVDRASARFEDRCALRRCHGAGGAHRAAPHRLGRARGILTQAGSNQPVRTASQGASTSTLQPCPKAKCFRSLTMS